VLVQDVDAIPSQSAQRSLDGTAHVSRRAVQPDDLAVAKAISELGRDLDVVAAGAESFSQKLFVGVWAIELGGVEMADTQIQSGLTRSPFVGQLRHRRRLAPCTQV